MKIVGPRSKFKMLAGAFGLLLALVLMAGIFVTPGLKAGEGEGLTPHQFWGNVTIDGLPAPPGTEVSVRVAGVANTFTTVVDNNGRYGYVPSFFVPSDDPDISGKAGGVAGDVLSFYVVDDDTLAATYVFEPLGATRLDLAITLTPTPTPTPVFPAWDINMNGCINVLDLILVGQHFGETGEHGWIREDVNPDGVINVLDLIIIGQHFGEGCGG